MKNSLSLYPVMMAYLMTAERAVCLSDENSVIIFANHKAAEVFAAPSYRDILGKKITDFIDPCVNYPQDGDVKSWLDENQHAYMENSEITCRDYNDEKIVVWIHHRRFFEVDDSIYMGCTITPV